MTDVGAKRLMREREGEDLLVCHFDEIFDIIGNYPGLAFPFSTPMCFMV